MKIYFVIFLTDNMIYLDPHAYLSDDTLFWCKENLRQLNHPLMPTANEFLPAIRRFIVPTWYRELRILARNHIESGENPILRIASKPDNRSLWEARQLVVDEIRNEVDTFGLVEGGDIERDNEEDEEDID